MISNKEYAKLLCDKVYNGDPKEMKYFVDSVLCAVETSRGLLAIKKPNVKTHICYGYGQGRDYESAQNASENVRSDYEVFLAENLFYDSASRMLKNIEKGCSVILDVSGQITDMISEDTIKEVEYRLKRAYKIDPEEWDNL